LHLTKMIFPNILQIPLDVVPTVSILITKQFITEEKITQKLQPN
jgi:hypothetical protein